MWFLIPNEEIDLTAIASDPATISFLINPQDVEMEEYEIAFSVPKFDVASKTDIKAVMNDMGIYAVFNENTADFSAISDTRELYLSKVEHATKIKIMEDGVEAASYMDFGVAAAGLPQKIREISFVLDRPFLFAITKGGRVPVYVGTIINPNNKQ